MADIHTVTNPTAAYAGPIPAQPLPQNNQVEIDEDFDSAYGESLLSDTTSLRSSIYQGYIENGRKYQTLREEGYRALHDETQFESQDAVHLVHLILDSQEGNSLFRSPISKDAQHILDIRSGTGIWSISVADEYPSITVTGIDLFPVANTTVPPNCVFEVEDAAKVWTWKHKFDFVHIRWCMGSFTASQWKALYRQAYENLVPGGWIDKANTLKQQVEPSITFRSDDGTLPADSLLAGWSSLFNGCAERMGRSLETWDTIKGDIEAAGFINIHEKLYKVPTGAWPKHPVYKDAGRANLIQFKSGMEGYAMWFLTNFGEPEPWSPEKVRVHLAGIRKELDQGWHIYQFTRRVWAQKPLEEKLKTKTKVEVEDLGAENA